MITPVVVSDAGPDEPFHDIPHDDDSLAGFRDFRAGLQPYFDVEVVSPTTHTSMWLRVTPVSHRPNDDTKELWHIDHGRCQRLNADRVPVGPEGTCNGYITFKPSPGHTIGKLDFKIN